MHPPPNSVIVDATQNHSRNRSSATPNNKEGRKLDIIGRRVCSLTSFNLRASNYLAAMGAYHRFLWNKALPSLQSASGEYKPRGLNFHQEATALAQQEQITVRHIMEAASKYTVWSQL